MKRKIQENIENYKSKTNLQREKEKTTRHTIVHKTQQTISISGVISGALEW